MKKYDVVLWRLCTAVIGGSELAQLPRFGAQVLPTITFRMQIGQGLITLK